jgi:hypothetical protein
VTDSDWQEGEFGLISWREVLELGLGR